MNKMGVYPMLFSLLVCVVPALTMESSPRRSDRLRSRDTTTVPVDGIFLDDPECAFDLVMRDTVDSLRYDRLRRKVTRGEVSRVFKKIYDLFEAIKEWKTKRHVPAGGPLEELFPCA